MPLSSAVELAKGCLCGVLRQNVGVGAPNVGGSCGEPANLPSTQHYKAPGTIKHRGLALRLGMLMTPKKTLRDIIGYDAHTFRSKHIRMRQRDAVRMGIDTNRH